MCVCVCACVCVGGGLGVRGWMHVCAYMLVCERCQFSTVWNAFSKKWCRCTLKQSMQLVHVPL